jgi:peptidoglycan/LPS O-acetylase OafA/YrhL
MTLTVFEFLGQISFPLYAIHYPVFEFVRRAVRVSGHDPSYYAPWLGLIVLSLLIVFCWAVGRYFDDPLRKRIGERFRIK